MRVSVIGSGYVGLVSGAGLSHVGHNVVCMDIDEERVALLRAGESPIYEPGLEEMLVANQNDGRLSFTASMEEAVAHADIILIAVGTPPDEDGSADVQYVMEVARAIGSVMTRTVLIVTKSTVPVGTCSRIREEVQARLDERGLDIDFHVASNPEFLAEGVAIADFMKPDRIVVGVDHPDAEAMLRELYAPFNRNHEKLLCMDVRSAELTKYAANAMLATRISAMNEMANIAEKVGADIEKVRQGIGSDPRIGYSFIYPGAGYGGSCFPKDVRALSATAAQAGYTTELLNAVETVNQRQRDKLFELLSQHFDGNIEGLKVAVWGIAFKPNTDDIREAPAINLIQAVLDAGGRVRAHDPKAMDAAAGQFGDVDALSFHDDPYAAAEGADALVLVTEWRQYWAPECDRLARKMEGTVIIDGRNIWSPEQLRKHDFTYYAIGRP